MDVALPSTLAPADSESRRAESRLVKVELFSAWYTSALVTSSPVITVDGIIQLITNKYNDNKWTIIKI